MLLGELGFIDIIFILSFFQQIGANRNLKKMQRIQLYSMLKADEDLDTIVGVLKEWKTLSKK